MVFPVAFGGASYAPYASDYASGYAATGGASGDTAGGLLAALDRSDNSAIGDTEATLSSLSQLQSLSDTFQDSLAQLLPPYLNGSSTGTSSNPAVLSVAAQSGAPSGIYAVTVNSLAQSEALQSNSFNTANQDVIGSGNLTITFGSYDATSNTFTPGAQAPVTVSLSNATLDDAATAINAAGAGVNAQVSPSGGGYALVLSGARPGAANAFEIQVDNASLQALSYDPTNASGSGLTRTQAAQDASLSVNGAALTSGSNSGVGIAPGLVVNLLGAGSSSVTSTPSSAAVQAQAQSLVAAYNTVQAGLAGASADSGAAQIASPYAEALGEAAVTRYDNGTSLFGTLSQIGLYLQAGLAAGVGNSATAANPGAAAAATSLSLDSGTLTGALASDATGTQSLLGAVVQAFYNIADSYGGGGGVLQGAQQTYESALYADEIAVVEPIEPALPGVDELSANQNTDQGLAPQQIQDAQLYARAFTPLQQNAWTSALLTEVYTPYTNTTGLLSALA